MLEAAGVHTVGQQQGREAVRGEAVEEAGVGDDEAVEAGEELFFTAAQGGAIPAGPGGVVIEAVVDPAAGGEAARQVGDDGQRGQDDRGFRPSGQATEELAGVEAACPGGTEGGPQQGAKNTGSG
jgi:hypothetical protein